MQTMSTGDPSLISTGIWVGIITLVIIGGLLFKKWEARHATKVHQKYLNNNLKP
jgi:hypothetical protein